MRTKRVIAVSLITFLIGGLGGSAYAYVTHSSQGASGQLSLTLNLEQAHENWDVEQFISEQEELRPDGMSKSKIATGSRYTGITYNHVQTATVTEPSAEAESVEVESVEETSSASEEKHEGLLSRLFGKKNEETGQQNASNLTDGQQTSTGRIKIQSGSLNVRAQSNTNSNVIGQVYKNDTVQIVSQDGAWYQVITQDGLQGYVSAAYVEVSSEE